MPAFPVAEVGVVDGLGFTLTNSWTPERTIRWCRLEHGGAAVMLQEYLPAHRPSAAAGRLGLGVGLNFICKDALAFYGAVKARGIAAKRPFVGNRSLEDPDGYALHFESPTDAPDESEYQE